MDKNPNELEKKFEPGHPDEDFNVERKEASSEKTEANAEDKEMVRQELMREIEAMDTDPSLAKETEDKARSLGSFAADKILEHLLQIARDKGVVYAIKVANQMNDPFILDTFHDLLAKEGYYKKL